MDTKSLLEEVNTFFPLTEMPSRADLVSEPHYIESLEVQDDMDEFRSEGLTKIGIRTIHRYLPVLSNKAIAWVLPHLLRFCILDEVDSNTKNVAQSLVFFLGPDSEFQPDTKSRLALLSKGQLHCLIHFLKWCLENESWDNVLSQRVRHGIELIEGMVE